MPEVTESINPYDREFLERIKEKMEAEEPILEEAIKLYEAKIQEEQDSIKNTETAVKLVMEDYIKRFPERKQ